MLRPETQMQTNPAQRSGWLTAANLAKVLLWARQRIGSLASVMVAARTATRGRAQRPVATATAGPCVVRRRSIAGAEAGVHAMADRAWRAIMGS